LARARGQVQGTAGQGGGGCARVPPREWNSGVVRGQQMTYGVTSGPPYVDHSHVEGASSVDTDGIIMTNNKTHGPFVHNVQRVHDLSLGPAKMQSRWGCLDGRTPLSYERGTPVGGCAFL
jgi:hypothetical protein